MIRFPQLLHSTRVGTTRRMFTARRWRPLARDIRLFGKAILRHLDTVVIV
jgi:hypothetical protein